jgi:polar amino acid transport system substrate-binding protein
MLKFIKLILLSTFILFKSPAVANEVKMDVYSGNSTLVVGTTGDFIPFEFLRNGEIVGFDIDLIKAIASKLGMDVLIRDMQFYSLIPSLQNGDVEVVIAGMAYTHERAKQVDFSQPYYFNKFAMLVIGQYDKVDPIKAGMKIGVQTGTLMFQWLQKQKLDIEIVTLDSNIQLVEELKSKRLNGILFDSVSAREVVNANPYLPINLVTLSGVDESGMSIAVKKDSHLLEKINKAIAELTDSGEMAKLKLRWGL